MISKSNFKFGRGRTDILEITLLAMNSLNCTRVFAEQNMFYPFVRSRRFAS